MNRLNKKYLQELRGQLFVEWNVVGSKIELIDHLLDELPTAEEALSSLEFVNE